MTAAEIAAFKKDGQLLNSPCPLLPTSRSRGDQRRLFAVALAVRGFTTNRVITSRIRLTLGLSLAVLALGVVLTCGPRSRPPSQAICSRSRGCCFALAVIHTVVLVARQSAPDRASVRSISDDCSGRHRHRARSSSSSTFVLDEKFLDHVGGRRRRHRFRAAGHTGQHVCRAWPSRSKNRSSVGNWVSSSGFEGEVVEITWRATKIRTRQGNLVIVPNSEVAKQAITTISEPAAPTRISFEIGAQLHNPPNDVKASDPRGHCGSIPWCSRCRRLVVHRSRTLRARRSSTARQFWIAEPSKDDLIRDELRTAIYYAFDRSKIEIPFPIQVQVPADRGTRE